jgi:diguanylate cyclase (GGDEF)-like protein
VDPENLKPSQFDPYGMKTATLSAQEIGRLLDRQRRLDNIPDQIPANELFQEILRIANQFVPSEAGSVLIDDPVLKVKNLRRRENNELVFVACFGDMADQLLGRRIKADRGIVGKTYLSGAPYISSDVRKDKYHYKQFDRAYDYHTKSIISVPIFIERSAIGVLELINRRDRVAFVESELQLLKIFAGYISTSLQNVLDGNRYRELAKRDDLTGLYNDRYFNTRLSEEIELSEKQGLDLSLIFLDLDHFKQVNDVHGHLVGSQTLREIGLTLVSAVQPERETLARYGGDEFVIIVPGANLERAMEVAEQIRAKIESTALYIEPEFVGTEPVKIEGVITASVGVASYREIAYSSEEKILRKNEFIRLADQAMYDAKGTGRNRVCYRQSAD